MHQVLMACREGVLHDMAEHGVECLDCVSVDNALVRMADPLFAGFCHEQNAQCGEPSQSGPAVTRTPGPWDSLCQIEGDCD